MSPSIFLDTNILLYAIGTGAAEQLKRKRALALLERTDAGLSVQVLQEFYVQATRPSRANPLPHDIAARLIRTWTRFTIQPVTLDVLNAALEIKRRHLFSYWDCAVIAAAGALGCQELYTEDMANGQVVDGVMLINPFL
jgi:predicted nucleic acid-binding protein